LFHSFSPAITARQRRTARHKGKLSSNRSFPAAYRECSPCRRRSFSRHRRAGFSTRTAEDQFTITPPPPTGERHKGVGDIIREHCSLKPVRAVVGQGHGLDERKSDKHVKFQQRRRVEDKKADYKFIIPIKLQASGRDHLRIVQNKYFSF